MSSVSRRDHAFRLPRQKYEDKHSEYINWRYLQEYLRNMSIGDKYATTIIVTMHGQDNWQRGHYVCDGNNDDVQINEALQEVASLGGGEVTVMEGTYDISDTITIPGDADIAFTGKGAILDFDVTVVGDTAHGISMGEVGVTNLRKHVISGFIFTGGVANLKIIECINGDNLIYNNTFRSLITCQCVGSSTLNSASRTVTMGNHFQDIVLKDQIHNAIAKEGGSGTAVSSLFIGNSCEDITDDAVFGAAIAYVSGTGAYNLLVANNIINNSTGLTEYFGAGVNNVHNMIDGVMEGGPHSGVDHGGLAGLTDDDHPQYILETLANAKGDLWVASAADTAARLQVGADGTALVADSGESLGVKWDTILTEPHSILDEIHDDTDFTDTPVDGDVLTWYEPAALSPPVLRAVGVAEADVTPALPAGTAVGDLLILLCETDGGEAVAVSGWEIAPSAPQTNSTNNTRLSVFYRIATGSDNPTITGASDHIVSVVIGFEAGTFESLDPFNGSAGSGGSSATNTLSIPNPTTTVNNCYVLSMASVNEDVTHSGEANAALTGFVDLVDELTTNGNDGSIHVMGGVDATAGAVGNTTATLSASELVAYVSLAINPAGAVGGRWIADAPTGGGGDLDDLGDVVITSPADGDTLVYDSASGDWVNATPGAGALDLDDLGDVVITAPADGYILTFDSASGDWIDAAPASTPSTLDDLTDVTITSPVDGDFLTYDSASGDWINTTGTPAVTAIRLERATSAQTINDNTTTVVIYNSIIDEDDPDGVFTANTGTGQITVNEAGWYAISAGVDIDADANTTRVRFAIRIDSGGVAAHDYNVGPARAMQAGTIIKLDATDVVEAIFLHDQSDSGTLEVNNNAASFLSIVKLETGVVAGGGSGGGGFKDHARLNTYTLSASANGSFPEHNHVLNGSSAAGVLTGTYGPYSEESGFSVGYLGWRRGTELSGGSGVLTITLDLGVARNVTEASIEGIFDTSNQIEHPEALDVEWSDDNSAWSTFGTPLSAMSVNPGSLGMALWFLRCTDDETHRYWRFRIEAGDSSGDDWLFVSKVHLYGST